MMMSEDDRPITKQMIDEGYAAVSEFLPLELEAPGIGSMLSDRQVALLAAVIGLTNEESSVDDELAAADAYLEWLRREDEE